MYYQFTEHNAEFNEFFARYGDYATEQQLDEFIAEMTHLSPERQQDLKHSILPLILTQF